MPQEENAKERLLETLTLAESIFSVLDKKKLTGVEGDTLVLMHLSVKYLKKALERRDLLSRESDALLMELISLCDGAIHGDISLTSEFIAVSLCAVKAISESLRNNNNEEVERAAVALNNLTSGGSGDGQAGERRDLKILIVEDDHITRLTLDKILRKYGTCEHAVDGREGIVSFLLSLEEDEPYDLICLDINIPKINGRDILRLIRRSEEERGLSYSDGVKVVVISGLDDPQSVIGSFKDGCEAYLVKPVSRQKLEGLLKKLDLIS